MLLYHGTNAANMGAILRKGLLPRGSRQSLWEEHPSATDRVYLTSAYAVYFACHAAYSTNPKSRGAIIEVDVPMSKLVADEDALALAKVADPDFAFVNKLDIVERTKFWRNQAIHSPHLAQFSLNTLGNVAHLGKIPTNQISRFVTFDVTVDLLLGHDPVICPLNFKFLGKQYQEAVKLFMDTGGKEGRAVTLAPPSGFA